MIVHQGYNTFSTKAKKMADRIADASICVVV
jgi:hypothetical protein